MKFTTRIAAQLRANSRDYVAVQDEASVESMRRILITFWFFGPIELALAVWYWWYRSVPGSEQTQTWAQSLFWVHLVTAVVTLVLAVAVRNLLRRPSLETRTAIPLQVAMCMTYLLYGVTVSYFDIAIGGIEAFILICFGVAGLSLMRPAISSALFGCTYVMVWQMLLLSDETGAQLAIMRLNSLIAVVLSVILSSIIFHQYAKGLLLRRKLEVIAGQDPLTLLPNRRELLLRLRKALQVVARNGKNGALLFIDLDHFKDINDTRGHTVGDTLLQEVGKRLSDCVREADTVARIGGDEFLVLLEELDHELHHAAHQADLISKKILERLNAPYFLEHVQHYCTSSIGIALFSPNESSVDELMKQADLAMYKAKEEGRNTTRFYDAPMQAQLIERAAMEHDLRVGLDKKQFVLYYQAQVTAAGEVIGAEALVRWLHPDRGLVPPGQFIALTEATGLIVPLGSWVLFAACTQLACWATQPGMDRLTLSVNVSAYQFRQLNFVAQVQQILAQTGANARQLKLELTESLLVTNVDDVIAKMNALNRMGIGISLDDFGTGYSSMTYLKRMPLHQLKIDHSFVQDMSADAQDSAIAFIIIQLSKTLGLNVIAEGVESAEQRDLLIRAGCSHFQGYFFGRPVPVQEFEAFARGA